MQYSDDLTCFFRESFFILDVRAIQCPNRAVLMLDCTCTTVVQATSKPVRACAFEHDIEKIPGLLQCRRPILRILTGKTF